MTAMWVERASRMGWLVMLAIVGCRSPEQGAGGARTLGSDSTGAASTEKTAAPPAASLCAPIEEAPGSAGSSEPVAAYQHILSVGVLVRAADGNSAGRSVKPDGSVHGYHMRGASERPFVSEQHGRVSRACVDAIWKLAAKVPPLAPDAGGPRSDPGTAILSIDRSDRPDSQIGWKSGQDGPDPESRALVKLLSETGMGYW
jgi:hypothetical protein